MKFIPLTNSLEHVTKVNDEDFEYLVQWKWKLHKAGGLLYAARTVNHKLILMHRVITNAPSGFDVDHWDGNGLNNTRKNLRVCTHGQNIHNQKKSKANTSGYKGVTWHKGHRKYHAQIHLHGKRIHLGYYDSPKEAADVYDKAAKEIFGEFARTNS